MANNVIVTDSIQSPVEELSDSLAIDTMKVLIPINTLRLANIKLNERLHLKDIVIQQEYIIIDYKQYTKEQESIIIDFQRRVSYANDINKQLQEQIKREQKKRNIWKGSAIGAIGATVLVLLLK